MIEIPLIDELREVRRRLADQCGGDTQRYAAMLRATAVRHPAPRADHPILDEARKREAKTPAA